MAAGAPLNPTATPVLTVLPLDGGGYALTYDAMVYAGNDLRRYFVDAHDGTILDDYSMLLKQGTVGTGLGVNGDLKKIAVTPTAGGFLADDSLRPVQVFTYNMRGDTERVRRVVNGSVDLLQSELAVDADNVWEDPAEVDGHVHTGWTYDYLFRSFGPIGVASTVKLITLIHPAIRDNVLQASQSDIDLFYLNAFYCPACGSDGNGILVYGEGLPDHLSVGGSEVDPEIRTAC